MVGAIQRLLHNWRAFNRTRDELSRLSDDRLRDIGVMRAEIPRVARRLIAGGNARRTA